MSDVEHSAMEPFVIDRELSKAAGRWVRFRRKLRSGEGFDLDPFEASRPALGRSTFEALLSMEGDPVAPSIARWVYRLTEQRINQRWLIAIARLQRETPEDPASEPSHAELIRRALSEPSQRRAWLDAAVRRAEPINALVSGLWERRSEIAHSMVPSGETRGAGYRAAPCENLASLAQAWLDASDALLQAPGSTCPPEWWLAGALGEVDPGWPAHLNPGSLLDLFRDTRLLEDLDLDPGSLPRVVAPSSFMRALARLGAAFLVANAPKDQPFSIAHDPYGLERLRHGALLGTLPLNPAFVMRRLGASREHARRATRSAAVTVLFESRLAALRVLLGEAALSGREALREAYSEGLHRCLRIELPGTAAGVLVKLRLDDPQRFSALMLAITSANRLRDEHDEDWFRNPRAIDQLRSEANRPPVVQADRDELERALDGARNTLSALLS